MHFGNLREISVKIGKNRKQKKSLGCLPENAGCIPAAVVIMTRVIAPMLSYGYIAPVLSYGLSGSSKLMRMREIDRAVKGVKRRSRVRFPSGSNQ